MELSLVLKNLIASADKAGKPARFTWKEINQAVRGLEYPLDYYNFLAQHEQDPLVKNLVVHFDDDGIELRSKNATIGSQDREDQTVKKMAKRATTKARG